jgi:hypothetical protein
MEGSHSAEIGEIPTDAERVEAETREELNAVDTDIINGVAMNSSNPAYVEARLKVTVPKFTERMEKVGEQLYGNLTRPYANGENWSTRMSTAFSDLPTTEGILERMAENLDQPVPDAEGGSSSHPYLEADGSMFRKGPPMYRIGRKIYQDMRDLGDILKKPLTPEQRSTVNELLGTLQSYASNDWGRAVKEEHTQNVKNHYTTRAINKMGQITIVLGAAAAALLVGTVGLAQRKFPTGGLVFAGIAAFVASPDLRKSVFGGANQAAIAEIDKHVNTNDFKKANKDHKIVGQSGANIVDTFIHPNVEAVATLDHIKHGTATQDEIEKFSKKKISPRVDPDGYKNLVALLTDKDAFNSFYNLRNMKDTDAIQTAIDFVRLGAGQFYEEVRKTEAQMESGETFVA